MNSNDKKVTFLGFGVLFLMIFFSVIFGSNVASDEDGGGGSADMPFSDMTLMNGNDKSSGELDTGASNLKTVDVDGFLVRNITAKLTWTDENSIPGRPRIRQYTNQPETFSLTVADASGNISKSSSGSNSVGSPGEVIVEISLSDDQLLEIMDMEEIVSSWMVEVTLDQSGGWTPRLGIIGITDGSNSYSLDIEYEYYDLTGDSEG